jgi:hypothetical protein
LDRASAVDSFPIYLFILVIFANRYILGLYLSLARGRRFDQKVTNMRAYFNQQLRWKRSNIVDFIGGMGHAWNLHPLLCMHYLSMFLLLLVYPFVIAYNIIEGDFFFLAMAHVVVAGALGLIYYFARSTRALPPWLRVHPLSLVPMSVLMPVAYIILTPLALFTLDAASWETRGHVPGAPAGGAPR